MKLKWIVPFCIGLLLSACGDKNAVSTSDMILAVRSLDDNTNFNGEGLQVALLDADNIRSEEEARIAAETAQWVSVDDFSSNNLVFREEEDDDSDESQFASTSYRPQNRSRRHRSDGCSSRRRDYHRTSSTRYHNRHGRHCWRPYPRDHWARIRISITYPGCRRGQFYRRGRCVLPYTPVHDYYWAPRYVYRTHRRRPHRDWNRRRGNRIRTNFRISFYW